MHSKPTPPRPLLRLYTYASHERTRVWRASLYSLLNKLFDLAPPILIGLGVDIVVQRQQSVIGTWLHIQDLWTQLLTLAALTFVVWSLESIFEYALGVTWRGLAQSMQHRLRLDAYNHVQVMDMADIEKRHSGSVLSVLNDDINQLERFLDHGANDIIQVLTTAITISAIFFYLAPTIAWMAIAPIPFILMGSFGYQALLQPHYAAVRGSVDRLNTALSTNLQGLSTIRSFGRERYEANRIGELSIEYQQTNRSAIKLSAAFSPLIRMIIVVGFTCTLLFGGWSTLEGDLSVGAFSVMVYFTQRLLWPLTRLAQTFDLYQRAMASTHRIFQLLDTPKQIADGVKELPHTTRPVSLRFENVSFQYQSQSHPVLDKLNLEITPGKTTAIVGTTGSGKTTLIKLLLRYYLPQQGEIHMDGESVSSLQYDSLRKRLALVSQDVFLFDGSVYENIRYGELDATEEQIRHAAALAEADTFIEALPDGYHTQIGERGLQLSGGQRQRLSIARAILKDPSLLILDEATSAVDNETEAAIQRSIRRLAQDRTILVIAHRLSTIRDADTIVVLDKGSVAQRGTHDSLLTSGGIYAKLWAIQTGANTQP